MRDVVICEPVRTSIGRFGGSLSSVPAVDLGHTVTRNHLDRAGLTGNRVDDMILGQCYHTGENPAIGRMVAGGAESVSQVEFAALGVRFGKIREQVTLPDRLTRSRPTSGGRFHRVPDGMLQMAVRA
jgi:acetyl-CoA C-acetyltransferase